MKLAPGLVHAFPRPRIVAILPAFNEQDVIGAVIRDYIEDGVEVYLIDNWSTDGTVDAARPFLGNGLIAIERFPADEAGRERARKQYLWAEILRRNEQLTAELGADWYVRADADEFRVGPWPGLSHAEAITLVDALGYTAIQSRVLEFRPTDDTFTGGDPREHLHYHENPDYSNALWIKAWKQPPAGSPVLIAASGGHEADFLGRRICPVSFISLHFPMRSSEHARRKIYKERLERYPREEREMGWHTHWDELAGSEHSFLWDPSTLERYDLDRVRSEVLARASVDMILTGRQHGLDVATRPVSGDDPGSYIAHAFGEPRPLTADGLETLSQGTLSLITGLIKGQDVTIPPDPTVQKACLALIEVWIADRRTRGDFHGAHLLEQSRDQIFAAVAAGSDATTVPGTVVASVGRNDPCPCGSGQKYKRCHGLSRAAA
jgi:SEC-C motif-containing protein/glycosyl transferase family 2